MTALAQVRHIARRIDAATPPQRDRAVDALRALAIAGVIGGHWLVTALVTGSSHHGTVLRDDSPLASMPWLAPLSWVGWVDLPAGWLVPYLIGIAWAQCSLRGRRVPALMLAVGAAATAALIAWAGYPASMVGVNGAHISNLNPPTLAAVTFGIAQCGLALLLRDRLALLAGRVPGLLTAPASPLWIAERLARLPAFAITLA